MLKRFELFTNTKSGQALIGLTDLVVAYGFASLAIDRGNFLWYALGLFFLFDGLRNITKLIGSYLKRGKQ